MLVVFLIADVNSVIGEKIVWKSRATLQRLGGFGELAGALSVVSVLQKQHGRPFGKGRPASELDRSSFFCDCLEAEVKGFLPSGAHPAASCPRAGEHRVIQWPSSELLSSICRR
jgi:hypothetical protein